MCRALLEHFTKLLEGFVASFAIASSIFAASAFSREVLVQGRDEHTILRVEHEWLRALVERDRVTLDRILPDDFVDKLERRNCARKGKCWRS
jgi:hypothetical protein